MDFLYRYQTLGTGAGRVKMDEEAGYSPHEEEISICHGDETGDTNVGDPWVS